MRGRNHIGFFILAAAVLAGLPCMVDPENSYLIYFLFVTFIYIALAQGWNLVAGYAGQISLGQHAFFGLGAYVTAISWLRGITGYFDPVAMLLSAVAAGSLAIVVGIPLLSKLRGDYFALGTLGLGEIIRVVITQGGSFTGGPVGLMLPSSAYTSITPYYFSGLGLASLSTLIIYMTMRSRVGLALVAIRDDETAASANGVSILKYKVLAFALGAFITGLCGSLHAYYLFHIHPLGFFNLKWALYPILMSILGGSSTIVGPVLGALVLSGVFELANIYLPQVHPIFSGALIILVMLFLPGGLVRLVNRGD